MSIYDQTAADTQMDEVQAADRSHFVRPAKGRSKRDIDSSSPALVLLPPYTETDADSLQDDDAIEGVYVEMDDASGGPADPSATPQHSPLPLYGMAFLKKKHGRILLYSLIVLLLSVVVLTPLAIFVAPPTATVMVVPVAKDMRSTQHILAVTGSPSGTDIQAHAVSASETSNALKVSATGNRATPAETARGMVTLSNNAPYAQTIVPGPGTIMTGSDGVQIQLDGVVTVPKGSPPNSNGVITVPAHAVESGASGNISAGDINTPCCASNIVALNEAAFSGGKDAQPYHVVSQNDIDGAVSTLKGPLYQQVQASITAKIQSGEQLGLMTSCSQQPQADPAVGTRSESVSVTLTMNCTGIVYNQKTATQQVTTLAEKDASRQLGASYVLSSGSPLHVSFEPATSLASNPNAIALTAHPEGLWVYRLDARSLAHVLAGKRLQDARSVLSKAVGVAQSSITIAVPVSTPWWNASTLPADPDRIHITISPVSNTLGLSA